MKYRGISLLIILWVLGVCSGVEKDLSSTHPETALLRQPRQLDTQISPTPSTASPNSPQPSLAFTQPVYIPSGKLPIVYIYTVVSKVCKHGFPAYIPDLWKHLVKFHSTNNDLIFLSNFQACSTLQSQTTSSPEYLGIHFLDVDAIQSSQTKQFLNASQTIFMSDGNNELWLTSATRFFHLDDFLTQYKLTEAIHLEADNVLFSNFSTATSHVSILRQHYPLAITPLVANKHLVTASFFWVGDRETYSHLLRYLMQLSTKTPHSVWEGYINYLRRYETSKKHGIEPDAFGRTIKPFAINEMTMLAYYHVLFAEKLKFLSVVPYYAKYVQYRPFCDLKDFHPSGREVGSPLLSQEYYRNLLTEEKAERMREDNHSVISVYSVFDAGSWGQYLGGTQKKRGRDKEFVDPAHISAQARISFGCIPEMLCENITRSTVEIGSDSTASIQQGKCYTAPFVKCGQDVTYTPILNLHVHSKHVGKFVSTECPCPRLKE